MFKTVRNSTALNSQIHSRRTCVYTVGYTGGVLSLVMQQQPILESPHFWTGSLALLLLGTNGAIAFLGFGKEKSVFRTIHAYLGSTTLCLLFLHAVLGLKLGLAI